jgi:hypothetical protein
MRIAKKVSLLAFAIIAGTSALGELIDEPKPIQGSWKQVSAKRGGRTLGDGEPKLEIHDATYTETQEQVIKCKLSLKETDGLLTVDREYEGVGRAKPDLGVFDLSGRRLRICFGAVRSSKVESTPKSNTMMFTWERQGDAPADSTPLARRLDGDWSLVGTVADGAELKTPPGMKIVMSIAGGVASEKTRTSQSGTIEFQAGTNKIDFMPASKRNGKRALMEYDPEKKRLTICQASIASPYPLNFETKSGSSNTLLVFEKEVTAP